MQKSKKNHITCPLWMACQQSEDIAAYLGLAASAAAIYLIKMGHQQVADRHQACRNKRSCQGIGYLIDSRLAVRIIKILAD